MNQNLATLTPLIILSIPLIFMIALIKSKSKGNQKYNSYQINQGHRMLCKSHNNRVIAGVCGGIAEYYGWNATIVRLVFIITGVGLLTYIVAAYFMPDSPSSLL